MKTINFPNKMRQVMQMVAVALCAFGGVQAQAASLTYVSGGDKFEQEDLRFGGVDRTTNTGAYKVKESTGDSFWVYCLDPMTYFQTENNYATSDLSTFVNSGYKTLFDNSQYQGPVNSGANGAAKYDDSNTDKATVQAKLTELYSHAYADSLTSNDKSGAFQYAIWEIEGDSSTSGYSSTSGGLQFNGYKSGYTLDPDFQTAVDNYLVALNTGNWNALGLSTISNYTYTVYSSSPLGGSQTVMKVTTASNSVPEPSSLLLLGIGVLALGASRRVAQKNP